MLEKSIDADPSNAQAYAWKACSIGQGLGGGYLKDKFKDDEAISELKSMIEKAIEIVKKGSPKNVFLEASGGINLETLTAYASTGVDAISIGALTTLAKNIDLKMEFKKNPE